jgi:hypothetical protein
LFISGPSVKYLGIGDHHDSKYEYLKSESKVSKLDDFFTRESTYSGVPVIEDYCPSTISVYPSDTMYYEYVTQNPIVLALISFSIFVFTSVVFIVYDSKVERRQKMVIATAVQTSTLVSSLFPSNVRKQLLASSSQSINRFNTKSSANEELESFLSKADNVNIDEIARSRPIADLYPDTTVFFADIAGFTAWSSLRDAYQVFTLLVSSIRKISHVVLDRISH